MNRLKTLPLCAALCLLFTSAWASGPGPSAQKLSIPSLEQREGQPIPLPGFWFAAAAAGPRPTIVMLHGCGGPYGPSKAAEKGAERPLSQRMQEYAELFNKEGWHVLVVDSLSPRGERELCTQKTGTRAVTMVNRRADALGTLQWLAQRPEVDAKRLVLLGWSNGGSTVLSASNMKHGEVKAASIKPRANVAFYPGCEAELKRGYEPSAPLLMLVGAIDDWTPPQPCQALAQASPDPKPQIESYAGAYHGFDSNMPVRLRKEVPNGVNPGQGVHVGGNAEALAQSRERLLSYLRKALQ